MLYGVVGMGYGYRNTESGAYVGFGFSVCTDCSMRARRAHVIMSSPQVLCRRCTGGDELLDHGVLFECLGDAHRVLACFVLQLEVRARFQ